MLDSSKLSSEARTLAGGDIPFVVEDPAVLLGRSDV
jgi:hypothetical protein